LDTLLTLEYGLFLMIVELTEIRRDEGERTETGRVDLFVLAEKKNLSSSSAG